MQTSNKKAKGKRQNKKKEAEPVKTQPKKFRFPTFGCLIFFIISFLSLILLNFLLPEPNQVQHPYLSSVSATFHQIGERVFGPVFKYSLLALDWFRLPPDDAIIKFGVDHNVEIIYDNIGVPHIYAKSRKDMTMAIGFVHARDRLFQMEINRLLSSGRLAEILGEAVLPLDRLFRVYSFHRRAKEDLLHLPENIKEYLQSYTDGINEYLDKFESQLPIEFTLLGFKPKHWQIIDILAISRFISWQLGYGDQIEFSRLTTSRILENDLLVDLDFSSRTLIENAEVTLNLKVIRELLDNYINPGGSNSFVISGKHTYSGKPILASDPHLQLTSPSIWYQMNIQTVSDDEPYHAVGVTMPGFPMIIYGHNDHVSWGCVLSLVDVKDHFLEKFDWEKGLYEYKGEMIKPNVYKEEIFIKGNSTPHIEYVYETVHGPVISLLSEDKRFIKDGKHIETSLQSISNLRKSTIAEGFYKLGLSKNLNDAKAALKLVDIVTLGFTVADNDNNIGYFTTGNIPIKKKGYGLIPSEGWTGKHDWQGTIPFEERPTIINPEKGYIVTANNRMVDETYPYYLGESFFPNTRSGRLTERIEEVIASGKKFDIDIITDIQNDVTDNVGTKFKQLFFQYFNEKSLNLTTDELMALEYFKQWNGKKDINNVGGAVSQAILIESMKTLLRRKVSVEDMNLFLGLSDNTVYNIEAFLRLIPNFVNLLSIENSNWWKGEGNNQTQILTEGFKKGIKWLKNELGSNVHNWKWGKFHRVKWTHVLARGKKFYLDQIFSVGLFECPGDIHTPNKAAYTISKENKRIDVNGSGVSYRQIIDHNNFDNALWVHGPGQSGRISSKHHSNQVDAWLNGRYFNMQWKKDRVLQYENSKIILSESL